MQKLDFIQNEMIFGQRIAPKEHYFLTTALTPDNDRGSAAMS